MAVDRPSRRASRVVYREAPGSDDDEMEFEEDAKIILLQKQDLDHPDDSNDSDYNPEGRVGEEGVKQTVQSWPPLSEEQRQFRQLSRLGDRVQLKQFLTDRPGLGLDVRCQDGTTVLNEAVTKTAQFTGVVEVLLEFGARLDVCDSLGNSPLHNAVLYHPSTQDTVDLLLLRGADTGAKNYEDQTPLAMADDKDLKEVLKLLRRGKAKGKGGKDKASLREQAYSPALRRKVTLSGGLDRCSPHLLTVRFNHRPPPASPGLLKRRRCSGGEGEGRPAKRSRGGEEEEEEEERPAKRRRVKWVEKDSTGASIDPSFSEEEEEKRSSGGGEEGEGSRGRCEEVGEESREPHVSSPVFGSPSPSESLHLEEVEVQPEEQEVQPGKQEVKVVQEVQPEVQEVQPEDTLACVEEVHEVQGVEEVQLQGVEEVQVQGVEERDGKAVSTEEESKDDPVLEGTEASRSDESAVKLEEAKSPKADSNEVKEVKEEVKEQVKEEVKVKPLKIHMKANGDDSELDELSQEGECPRLTSVQFANGFGFFVN